MISNEDLDRAIVSCKSSLKRNACLFVDNYEDSRIEVTNYFNGEIVCNDNDSTITRVSSTTRISDSPRIVRWDARYSGVMDGSSFNFEDSIEHRAFSRAEFSQVLQKHGFVVEDQSDNFDETSFYTFARKSY